MTTRSTPDRTAVEPILETIEHVYDNLDVYEQLDGESQSSQTQASMRYQWNDDGVSRYIQATVLEDNGYEVEVEWHVLNERNQDGETYRRWDHDVTATVEPGSYPVQNAVWSAYKDAQEVTLEDLPHEHTFPISRHR